MNESGKRIYRKSLIVFLVVCIASLAGVVYEYFDRQIPSVIHVKTDENGAWELGFPATAKVISVSRQGKSNIPREEINIDLSEVTSLDIDSGEQYNLIIKLFGFIPLKQAKVSLIEDTELIPVGIPVGIYMETEGVMVVGTGEITDLNGNKIKPAEYILKSGDYISKVNGFDITTKEEVTKLVAQSQGNPLDFEIIRDGEIITQRVVPVADVAGEYKIGVWLRDNTQGVGTLTYIDADGNYGALGHGITDVDTGLLMNLEGGTLYETKIASIDKGSNNSPGEIVGMIIYTDDHILGTIDNNSEAGIFGSCSVQGLEQATMTPLQIGLKQEIKKGPAQIICAVEGTPIYYDIEITDVHMDHNNVNHELEIKVTDERLIAVTGGIVQGMSGSPIIQGGKIIGAITHVLVNDPTRGYGIFIDTMLEH